MNFFNFNFLHNVLNVLIAALAALLVASGCVASATGTLDCSQSWINAEVTAWAIAVIGFMKIAMNVLRDGVFGLFKVQPPVVDKPLIK